MLQLLVSVQTFFAGLRDEERGATAVEYGLMVSLIAVAIVVAVSALGTDLTNIFTNVGATINAHKG